MNSTCLSFLFRHCSSGEAGRGREGGGKTYSHSFDGALFGPYNKNKNVWWWWERREDGIIGTLSRFKLILSTDSFPNQKLEPKLQTSFWTPLYCASLYYACEKNKYIVCLYTEAEHVWNYFPSNYLYQAGIMYVSNFSNISLQKEKKKKIRTAVTCHIIFSLYLYVCIADRGLQHIKLKR